MINDGSGQYKLHIVDSGPQEGQFWKLTQRSPGKYDLSTRWLGPNKVLDVINDAGVDSTSVHLTNKDNIKTGQSWTFTPWGDGSWRLTNDFTGPNKRLVVYPDTKIARLDIGDHTGKHWHVKKAE